MKLLVGIVMVMLLATSCTNENDSKVIYMVRHAEKSDIPKNDPPLTTDGVIRSVDLASWFKGVELDTVFSTDFKRMKETAKPVAEDQGLEVSFYNAKEFDSFATQLKEMKADTILVLGHSNTILPQIEALGLEKPQQEMKESEYDKIFEIRLGKGEVITHSYGTKYKD